MVLCIWNNLKISLHSNKSKKNMARLLVSSLLCISIRYCITPTTSKNYVLKSRIFAVQCIHQRQVRKKDRYILICLTNSIKGDTIILPHRKYCKGFISFSFAKLTTLYRGGFFVIKNIKNFYKKVLTSIKMCDIMITEIKK